MKNDRLSWLFIFALIISPVGCGGESARQVAVEKGIESLSRGDYSGIIKLLGKSPPTVWRHPVVGYLLQLAYTYAEDRDQWANQDDKEAITKFFRMSRRGDAGDKYYRADADVQHVELTFDILCHNYPDNAYYKFALAGVYDYMQRSGSKDKKPRFTRYALEHLDKALMLRPDDESILLLAAVISANSGDIKLAEKYFRRIEKPLPRTIVSIGSHYLSNGFHEEAVRVFTRLIKEYPDYGGNHRAYIFLAQAYGRIGMPEKVIDYAQKALTYNGSDKGAAYQLIAAALVDKGEISEPIKLYGKAASHAYKLPKMYRDQRLHQYYSSLEILYLRRGEYATSWKYAKKRPLAVYKSNPILP